MNNNYNNNNNHINNNNANNLYTNSSFNNNSNSNERPYLVMTNEELQNKKRKSRFLFATFYLIAIVIGVSVFYLYRVDKYEFYLPKQSVLIANGSTYHVELTPKNSMYFDYGNYIYEIENPSIATVDEDGIVTAISNGVTNLLIRYKNGFTTKKMIIEVNDIKIEKVEPKEDIVINDNSNYKIDLVVNDDERINVDFNYKSNDPAIIDVDDFGNITPITGGETTVTIIKGDEVVADIPVVSAVVKVVEKITFAESSINLKKGSTTKLVTSIIPSDISTNLTFVSNNDNVSVDNEGNLVANKVGNSIITVYTANGKKDTCNVNVTEDKIAINELKLSDSTININVGETYQYKLSITPENATERNITWTSSDEKVVMVNDGKIKGLKSGTAVIKVQSSNGKSATSTVYVKENAIEPTSISLTTNSTSIYVGDSKEIGYIITPNNASKAVEWTSSNKNVATVLDGKVVGVAPGSAVITAKTQNGKIATCSIVVIEKVISVASINLNNLSANLRVNETFQLVATVTPSDATSKTIKWTSSNSNIASVDQNGLVKANSVGTAIIKAEADGKSVSSEIIVSAIPTTGSAGGSCLATLYDGKTTYSITSSTGAVKYDYNGFTTTSSTTYVVDRYIRDTSYVIFYDSNGGSKKVTCTTELKAMGVKKPSGDIVHKAESATLKVYVVKTKGFYLSYIWAQDPVNQLRKQHTKGSSKKPADILKIAIEKNNLKNKIMLGFNASAPINSEYWESIVKKYPEYNLKEPSSLIIYNGKVLINDYKRYPINRQIYYVDGSNQLKYIDKMKKNTVEERRIAFQNVIDAGTRNTFSFHSALVYNGQALDLKKITKKELLEKADRRQALCQVDSNNFILVTSVNGDKNGDIKREKLAQKLVNLGCKSAVNLDGGGSTATFFKKRGTEKLTTVTGGGRELTSAMYFTE